MPDINISTDTREDPRYTRHIEEKFYELTDHLGNVGATLSDRKLTGSPGSGPYYADIRSYNHPYPFGMPQPKRFWDSVEYRYGFSGMETDPEVKGTRDHHYTTHFRQYDPRIGRWWSHDPVTQISESPYAAMYNNPVSFTDPMGDCPECGSADNYELGEFKEGKNGKGWTVQENTVTKKKVWVGTDEMGAYVDYSAALAFEQIKGATGSARERTFMNGVRRGFQDLAAPVGEFIVNVYDSRTRGEYLKQKGQEFLESGQTLLEGGWTLTKATLGDALAPCDGCPSFIPALSEAQQERNAFQAKLAKRISEIDVEDLGYISVKAPFIILDVAIGSKGKSALDLVDAVEDAAENGVRHLDDISRIPGGCFVGGTLVAVDTGLVPIETLRVGDRVTTTDTAKLSATTAVDPPGWRHFKIRMANPQYLRDSFDIDMIRPYEWTAMNQLYIGGRIEVNLDEIGLSGIGILQDIQPCPEVRKGDGRVVLATVTHANSYIHRLSFEGSNVQLELTDRHRLYSLTRDDWIATEGLAPGEELRTQDGMVVLSENTTLSGTQRVFNLQIETDECYFVSKERVLSHNVNPCGKAGSGWLRNHEGPNKGHSIAKHVGKSDQELIDRLNDASASGRPITGSSSFTDLTTAERVVEQVIKDKAQTIDSWLQGPNRGNLVLNYEGNNTTVIGRGINRGETVVSNRTTARIILKKDGNGKYFILTSYPGLR